MQFFIKELLFFCIEKFFLETSKLLARIFPAQKRVLVLKELPNSSIGDVEIGESLLKKISLFGNVILDVKTDNPWRILPFSEEVEVGIDGFSWLNDLAIVNSFSSRELSKAWIESFPLDRLNRNVQSSSARLAAIVRNFSYIEIFSDTRHIKKVTKILNNDYFFITFYKNFSFNTLERISICHSLVLAGFALNLTKKSKKKLLNIW